VRYLDKLSQILVNRDLQLLIKNPKCTSSLLYEVLSSLVFQDNKAHDQQQAQLLHLLITNQRLDQIEDILTQLNEYFAHANGILSVHVYTATKLDQQQRKSLQLGLANRQGAQVELTSDINTNLIAGICIKANSTIEDYSYLAKIKRLQKLF